MPDLSELWNFIIDINLDVVRALKGVVQNLGAHDNELNTTDLLLSDKEVWELHPSHLMKRLGFGTTPPPSPQDAVVALGDSYKANRATGLER